MGRTYEERKKEPYRVILNTRLKEEQDRRRKLPTSEHEHIRQLYFGKDKLSQRAIANLMGVSRRLIVFILYPERLEQHKKLYKERRKDGRYKVPKEKWAKLIKEHRHYKKSIIK